MNDLQLTPEQCRFGFHGPHVIGFFSIYLFIPNMFCSRVTWWLGICVWADLADCSFRGFSPECKCPNAYVVHEPTLHPRGQIY